MIVLKWKRKNASGQTLSQCGRFWFVDLAVGKDDPEYWGWRLWHADSETLVGHYASASECKAAAQSYLDWLRAGDLKPGLQVPEHLFASAAIEKDAHWFRWQTTRNEEDDPLDRDDGGPTDELVKVCKATDDNPVDEFTIDGARIVRTRTLTQAEVDNEIWPETTVALELENGVILYASQDPEGNGPGALFGQYPDGCCFQLGVTIEKEQTDA
jgi:hypothetical protein